MAQGKSRTVWLIAAIVVIVGSAYFIFRESAGQEKFSRVTTVEGICLACKQEVQSRVSTATDIPPYECPKCKQKAVLSWWYCHKCKKRIIPEVVRPAPGQIGIAQPPRCAQCKSQMIEIYVPGFYTQTPTGDGPLPKFP